MKAEREKGKCSTGGCPSCDPGGVVDGKKIKGGAERDRTKCDGGGCPACDPYRFANGRDERKFE